jgi:branched-chain amino acid transport system permease protein
MIPLLQSLVDAVSAGAIYALAALGIGLVFGIMRLANLAHGEIITGSAYTLIFLWEFSWPLALVASAAVGVIIALVMNFAVFHWLRAQSPATLLIASFGLSIVFQRLYDAAFGTNVRTAPVGSGLSQSIAMGGIRINLLSIITIVLGVVLLLAVHLFLSKTSIGLQVKAASSDFRMARILGVRSGFVIAITFAISGLLAAAVAFALTTQSGAVGPTFGVQATLFGLVGAVLGGLSKLSGAVVGGFAVGVVLSLFTSWLPPWANDFRTALVYVFVIIALVIAPNGLLAGRSKKDRT